jgi:hypothetical protein
MSIAVLNQVYDEARRLAVAGSVVAPGDFRLKKLVAPLEQAGAKAPVFAKVAECAKAVVEGSEATSARSLLELTSLVSAVLYTQGETGHPGKLEPIETIDLGGAVAQTSARLLKPLLEALTETGSGRVEVIRDAHQQGAFRDLRLVRPALAGLDDPYADVADFLAETVLPMYGRAILSELRAKYDPKGGKGHPRRLKLMHALDPAGTRELVKQALESGSKEVKVAAIECLGAGKEDLAFLVEQAGAKTQDVRGAAYRALARTNAPAAVAVLAAAITGKDLGLAAAAVAESKNDKLINLLVDEIRKETDALVKLKDKKKVSEKVDRITALFRALPDREHAGADALVFDLFNRRGELARVKGTGFAGSDVVEAVFARMLDGPKPVQAALARAHAKLDDQDLTFAAIAGRRSLPAAEVYDLFSPYVTAAIGKKPGKKDKAASKRDSVLDGLGADHVPNYWPDAEDDNDEQGKMPALDPRWLDLGLKTEDLGLVHAACQPGHSGAHAFLSNRLAEELAKKTSTAIDDIVVTMIRFEHPGATDALIAAYEKFVLKVKGHAYTYWYESAIPTLPKSAIPQLEAFIPKVKSADADDWLTAIQKLRDKT